MDKVEKLEKAAVEVIVAHREHNICMVVGGHQPDRINAAVDALEIALKEMHTAQ